MQIALTNTNRKLLLKLHNYALLAGFFAGSGSVFRNLGVGFRGGHLAQEALVQIPSFSEW